MGYLSLACAVLLAVVLGAAGISKVRGRVAYRAFAEFLTATGLTPARRRRAVGPVVVAAELTAAVLLIPPSTRGAGFAVASGLLASLTAGAWVVVRRRIRTPCRCFGGAGRPLARRHVLRNAALTAVGLIGLAGATADAGAAPAGPGGAAVAAAGATLALVAIRLDDLIALLPPPANR
jgi:hypothetical protein